MLTAQARVKDRAARRSAGPEQIATLPRRIKSGGIAMVAGVA